jgi:glycosyltransferase involved in cell wall biosynthesis
METSVRKRLRVMMIGPYPPSPDRIDGGVAAAMTYLSEALAAKPDIELIGIRVAKRRTESAPSRQFNWPIAEMALGRLGLTTLYRRQRRCIEDLIRAHRPDIVHAQGADIAGFLAVRSGVPTVVTVHGLLVQCAKLQSNPVEKARSLLAAMVTERYTVRRATHLIAISPYVTRYYGSDIRGRVYDIPNPVAPAFFEISRAPEPGRLLYAGRISNGKGLLELLRAIARNRPGVSRLVLAGTAPDREYQRRLVDEVKRLKLMDCVVFAGLLREGELHREFARAVALLLPSHQETAPMVVQEAMAAGLPVIASDVGGIPEQLQHEVTGLMFPAGDVDRLSDSIARLISDSQLGLRMGKAAAGIASQRYHASAIAQATTAVYRSMISECSGRHASHAEAMEA